jgi:hypothetical protein
MVEVHGPESGGTNDGGDVGKSCVNRIKPVAILQGHLKEE